MANEQIDVVATQIEKQRKGYFGLSLSGMLTSSAPTIISGSVIEIAGSLFQFTSDESINASSWTAISTASDVYIYLESDGATVATLTAYYTDNTPVWREDYNGWYMSAGSSIRVIAGVYKTSAVAYDAKYYLNQYGSLVNNQTIISFMNNSRLIKGVATGDELFDLFSPLVSATADTSIITGNVSLSGNYYSANRLAREDSVTVRLYCLNAAGSPVAIPFIEGASTEHNIILLY